MTDERKDDAVKPYQWRITIPETTSPDNRWFKAERFKRGKPVAIFLGGHGWDDAIGKRKRDL